MTQHRLKWPSIAAAGFALAITAGTALAQREEDGAYRDGYRRGFDEGFAQGYRKGLDEGRPPVVVAPLPPPPPPPPRRTISITRATYGAGAKRCDASRAVRMIANGQVSASIEADNDLCGDPAQNQRKRLEVHYVCGRTAKSAFANERDSVYLDCR